MFKKSGLSLLLITNLLVAGTSFAQSISELKVSSLSAIKPANELSSSFFPAYLQAAFSQLKQNNKQGCQSTLQATKISSYSAESEKYYLLQAYCTKKTTPEETIAEVQLQLKKTLSEKASSSDVLFAAALALSENSVNDQALNYLTDANWFKSFKLISKAQYYFTLGRIQLLHNMIGEAHISLLEAKKFGEKSPNLNLLILECKTMMSDRKGAIALSDELNAYPQQVKDAYRLRALMTATDPIYNKKDIQSAAELSEKLGLRSAENKDLAIAAIKALLYVKNFTLAQQIAEKAVSLEPTDGLLASLKTQAFAEGKILSEE